ncbi:MAG TPA: hypothetical protein VIN08_15430 [Ohtaekwangia sp.]
MININEFRYAYAEHTGQSPRILYRRPFKAIKYKMVEVLLVDR